VEQGVLPPPQEGMEEEPIREEPIRRTTVPVSRIGQYLNIPSFLSLTRRAYR
jgi:hypothetical protein